MHKPTTRARLAAACAAAFLACVPAPAFAADGQIRVDLQESVGAEWFERIGDREVEIARIEGVSPTPEDLQALDVPALKRDQPERFEPVETKTTVSGTVDFGGLDTGVYLVSVADNPGTADKRVSYSPFVVALTPDNTVQVVAPKAQQLGVAVDVLTACNTSAWKEAAAPGTYVEYDFVATVPNLSTEGTLGAYELSIEFSRGHTVQWEDNAPRSVLAYGYTPLRFDAAAATTTISGTARNEQPVEKLTAPRLTIHGAGEEVRLERSGDYTEEKVDNDTARFTLTAKGRSKLARLKALDPATTVELWVPAKANAEKPWGSGAVRDATLGDLEATATLTADGMDETRGAVSVSHTNHTNVVERGKCFDLAAGTTPAAAGTTTATTTAADSGPVTEVVTRETTRSDGSATTVTETRVQDAGGGDTGSSIRKRVGDLAYTGAGVIGISGVAVLLIIVGLFLRRRDGEEE